MQSLNFTLSSNTCLTAASSEKSAWLKYSTIEKKSENISIEAVTQHESDRKNTTIPIVMITNSVKGELINNAIKLMKNLHHVKEEVHFIRVLKSDE